MSRRPNWSRTLSRPINIPDVMTLATLGDVRTFIGHLPADRRTKATWQYVELRLGHAAQNALDTVNVSVPLQMALTMAGVPWRMK